MTKIITAKDSTNNRTKFQDVEQTVFDKLRRYDPRSKFSLNFDEYDSPEITKRNSLFIAQIVAYLAHDADSTSLKNLGDILELTFKTEED